jgi:uronate dehydrogenase
MAVWACSNNTRMYWDNTGAEKLGYKPTQNAETSRRKS